jgi:hypothetical protein
MANSKHDLIAIKCYDPIETTLPKIGLVRMLNPEKGKKTWVNTNSTSTRKNYEDWWNSMNNQFEEYCKKTGIDKVILNTNEPYATSLMKVFKKRGLK